VEHRLVPVNALIALCLPGDVYPTPLANAGYHLSGIDVPVVAGDGKVVIDAVLFRPDHNIILAGEAKSGANVEEDQARRYGDLVGDDVVVAAAITIREAGDRQLQPVYACVAENLDRVLKGLGEAGLACPVLAIGDDRIEHHGATFIDSDLQEALAEPVPVAGPPPRVIPVDDKSPEEAFDSLVLPALVAILSHQRQQVSVPVLAEQALPHLAIFGKAARNRLVAKVDAAARRAARRDPATFEYLGRTGTREYAVVRLVRSPEDAARQGRTQVYQSIARAAGKPPRRRPAPSPDQMTLFEDLIEELQQADEMAEGDDATSDDEEGQ
jgi:hypothetical protein